MHEKLNNQHQHDSLNTLTEVPKKQQFLPFLVTAEHSFKNWKHYANIGKVGISA